jgi:biopolymer transport protein ExbD
MGATPELPKRHKKSRHLSIKRVGIRLDMTPMVDVAFLLLTFFMITTTFRRPQTIEITLPKESLKRKEFKVLESNILQLAVNRNQDIFYKAGSDSVKPVGSEKLQSLFIDQSERNLSQNEGATFKDRYKLIVVVKLDPKSQYEMLVKILDDLNLAIDSLNSKHRLLEPQLSLLPRFTVTRLQESDPIWMKTLIKQ